MSWACQCLPLLAIDVLQTRDEYVYVSWIPSPYIIFSLSIFTSSWKLKCFSHYRHLPIFSLQNCRMDVMILKWLGALLSLLVCHLLALFFRLVFHSHITRVLRLSYLKYDLIYVFGADSVNAMQWAPRAAYAHITT